MPVLFSFARALDPAFARDRTLELDRTLTRALTFARGCDPAFAHAYPFALYTFYACDHALAFEPELKHDTKRSPLGESLQQLQAQLPDVDDEEEKLKQWWQNNGQAWAEKLRSVMMSIEILVIIGSSTISSNKRWSSTTMPISC
jgi:hypothetical protein